MEFRETLLAAQKNQQQKSSENVYYKARFDPPKKEQKSKDKLSSNIQKFLAKKEEEEQNKKLEALRKRDELLAMRDPKAMRKIQKSLKVFKSANKSVLDDAIDREHTAVTREGELADQDDYGYESQEAAAIYKKMMDKYSKVPDEPKFPTSGTKSKKDLDSTKERVKQALLHVDDPVPHKRRRKTATGDDGSNREPSPPPAPQHERKPDKPKFRKPAPPPMDFNQLLKLAEQKKAEPLEVDAKKVVRTSEGEPERLMTKKQKREYEEEMARRLRRQERLDAEAKGSGRKVPPREQQKEERPPEKERSQPIGFGRIPKISERNAAATRNDSPKARNDSPKTTRNDSPKTTRNDSPKPSPRDKERVSDRERERVQKDRERPKVDKDKLDKERQDQERLEKLKAERERIERDIQRLNKDRERLEKTKMQLESSTRAKSSGDRPKASKEQDIKKNIDLKSQNTYRIDKNSNEKRPYPNKSGSSMNGHSSQGKPVPKLQSRDRPDGPRPENGKRLPEPSKGVPPKGRPEQKPVPKSQAPPAKPKIEAFDFDKAVSSLRNGQGKSGGASKYPPGDVRRKMEDKKKQMMKRRRMESDSEYDSEMDDFIDDRDEDLDYSKHIKEIFGYDKSKYRDVDDEDDPSMESSFSRQMHEEFVSKKIGIMEDLEDIRLEKKMNKMKKKKRRLSDD